MSEADPAGRPARRFRIHPVAWIGLAILAVGVGPPVGILLAARLGWTADPNPNPIGPGIAAILSIWPGIGLLVIGIVLSFLPRRTPVAPTTDDRRATTDARPTQPTRPSDFEHPA